MKRILLTCFSLLVLVTGSNASHLMGGEITWKCLPNGQFQFKMKVYRDCNGITFGPPVSLDVHNYPGLTSISMNLVSQTDISPACNAFSGNQITCAGATGTTAGAVEEFVFQSNPITLSGTPPAAGWIFSYSNCCRNSAIDNLAGASGGGLGFTLRAKMFAYNGLNTNPCYDSSPQFTESPNTIICTGYPFRYNHNAVDPELDSLVYSWEKPLESWGGGAWSATNPAPINFSAGYSYTSPLPGPAVNPNNVAAVLDPSTGDINYTSFTSGVFVTVNKVSSYKCGQLVSEIYREIQVALLTCQNMNPGVPNNPPTTTIFDSIKQAYYPSNYTIIDTVYAGQNVTIEFSGTDFDVDASLAIADPPSGGYQKISLTASGGEFGTNWSSTTTGCQIPPCATLYPIPPATYYFYTGTTFRWQTNCDHLGYTSGCVNFQNVYTFIIKLMDDFCPAPGVTVNTVKIVLLAPPQVNAPDIKCTKVEANGDVTLTWAAPLDTFNTFDAYLIYHSSNIGGPYTLIDSVFSLSQNTYTHFGAGANAAPQYYYIVTRDLCKANRFSNPSDTVASMYLTATNIGGGQAQLNWNPVTNPLLSSSSGMYHIFMEYPVGTWTLIDSTVNNTYIDLVNILTCSDSLNYRVEISDALGCTSISSIDGATFQNYTQPDPPSIRCLVADNNGDITLSWVAPVDTGLSFDGYYIYSATNAGGPFTIIDSIFNYNITSYPHTNSGIMTTPRYYYLQTYCKCGNAFSVNSDTVQAIRLTVLNVGGVAQLSWNPLRTPLLPSSSPRYLIYQEYPPGIWTLIDSTSNTFINIPKVVCSDSINFRVQIADASGCISKSTIDGKYFVDNTIPDPPELRCISVNANGSINLNWTLPVDTGMDYNSYHLYYSTSAAGPFTEIDSSFNYSQSSYTHTAANAYSGPVFYTIKTRTGCGVQYSAGSDTLQAILLNVSNPTGGNIANLSWNAIRNPLLPTASGFYNIYKEYPLGNWNWIATTANLNYIDTNPVCIDSINYRVEMSDASGCTSVSTIDGATFIDNSVPDAPELRCISVNANGSINLNWTLPVDTGMDYNSYHLYYSTSAAGPFTEIDSSFNYSQSSYTHTAANAYSGPVFYTIKTRTGCGVQYSAGSDTLQAILLNVSNPTGGNIANLSWNAIRNPLLPTASGFYNIYKEYPLGNWNWIATTANLNYIDTNPVCIDSINYRVEMSDASGCTSVSTIDGATFIDNSVPDAPELRCISVNANGSINLNWTLPVDTGMDYNSYHLYYSTSAAGPFTEIDSSFNYSQSSYTHTAANAYLGPVFYTIKTRTGCGVQYSAGSDTLQAMLLNVSNPTGGNIANLSWNAIRNPLLPTASGFYNIYKEYPLGNWNWIATTANLNYVDTNPVCIDSINYRVEMSDASGCTSVSTIDGATFIDNSIPDAPELRCISVNANGSVNLNWTLPVDTGMDYNSYHLYYSTSAAGPFTEIDSSFNYSQSSFTHTAANAYLGPVFYTIKTRTGCGVQYSAGSDTLQAILLNVSNPTGGNIANLSWNAIRNPLLPTASGFYNIYKEYPLGNWNWIATTANLNYVDTNPVCIDSINYRVEMSDASGCTSVSTIDGSMFTDNSVPDAPELRCISVNANGSVNLNWTLPVDTGMDYNSYHLYYSTSAAGPFNEIDSTFNYNQSSYTHTTANAYAGDVFYTLKTRTGCGVQYSVFSDTIQAIRIDVTNPSGGNVANLNWNPIRTPLLPTTSGSYNVFKEYPAGIWNLIGTTASLNYVDTNPVCIDSVNYRVEMADASGCTSVSTIDGAMFMDNTVPDAPQLRCLNVNADGTTTLSWVLPVDTGLDYNSYHIYQSNSAAGPFTIIDSLFNYNIGSYTDAGAIAYSGPLFYTIRTRTGCGVQYSFDSDTLQAIVLDVTNPGGLNTATLNWNRLHNPDLSTSDGYYRIYKEYPAGSWSLVDSTMSTTWQEPITLCYDSVHYQVGIADNSGCESRSTIDGDLFIDNTIPDAPDLRCVAIDATGQVTLTWIPPVDTGLSFNSYHVFYSTGGSYSEIDSIFNYNATSYLHTGANANATNVYYYVESRTNCGVQYSAPSDTLHAIKLNVTATPNGLANLQWNAVHVPLLPSSDLYYKIYREYPPGTWSYLDSTTALTYQDTINLCQAFINYRVEIADAIGCISVSSIDGDLFKDGTAPALTIIDTASVNPATGQVTISWLQNTSSDVVGYRIYLFNGASWDSIGDVSGINSLSFLYAASNANNVIENYCIAAYDSCDNRAPLGVQHNSIHLTDTLDKCSASVILNWNPYINMQGGLASYNIYVSENGAPYTLLANVGASSITYTHQSVKKDTAYCYYVQAVGDFVGRTASSNEACILADVIILPEFTYLKRATVVAHDQVLIECYVDTAADLSRFKLIRSDNNGVSYEYLQDIAFTGNPNISFTDFSPSTDSTSYYYKVVDVSTCDKDVQESNIGRTILLKAIPFENLINKLEWNPYEDWSGKVALYNIFRYYDGVWTTAPIATVNASTSSYYDNIANFIEGTGEFCYMVQAAEGPGNIFGFGEKSESNEACAVQEPHLYLPSGFTPGGQNPTFHPYMIYILKNEFQMQVFNRWGQKVYSSGDPDQGWDGTFDGQDCPQGVYVYHVKVKGANGKTLEKRGTVTLLR